MSNQTHYEATETGVDMVIHGRDEWRKSVDHYYASSKTELEYTELEYMAYRLNEAYQRGRTEQREDIRKALGIR
jgi:hypothetical protein